jgi:hypothetical protein
MPAVYELHLIGAEHILLWEGYLSAKAYNAQAAANGKEPKPLPELPKLAFDEYAKYSGRVVRVELLGSMEKDAAERKAAEVVGDRAPAKVFLTELANQMMLRAIRAYSDPVAPWERDRAVFHDVTTYDLTLDKGPKHYATLFRPADLEVLRYFMNDKMGASVADLVAITGKAVPVAMASGG